MALVRLIQVILVCPEGLGRVGSFSKSKDHPPPAHAMQNP